jgi:sulfate adenylyltransferase subunit 1
MKLIRLFTAGNVDDGKSTLIGRLLIDSGAVSTDIIQGLTKVNELGEQKTEIDLAFLTDGLRSERELGITIDVAYKYFSTHTNKYIIADTPGHWEYTRNMFTGASLCDVAIILVDVTIGITEQTKRHALIASLLRVKQIVFAINKMDLINYDEAVFEEIKTSLLGLSKKIKIISPTVLPMSALKGENVVNKSNVLSWFKGPTLFDYLENSPQDKELENPRMRYQVQYLIHANKSIAYAGRIDQGVFEVGQEVLLLPKWKNVVIKEIIHNTQSVKLAESGNAVSICFENETEIKRGDLFSDLVSPPRIGDRFTANICWMSEFNSVSQADYIIQIGAVSLRAKLLCIREKKLENRLVSDDLMLNDIATVDIETEHEIVFDRFEDAKETGSFILIDPVLLTTIAAGIII